ncbi:hypothetical protein B7463_g4953, partial [Scytalidium lignicola]
MNQNHGSVLKRSPSPVKPLRIYKHEGDSQRGSHLGETDSSPSSFPPRTSSLYSSEQKLSPEIFVEIPGQEKPSASTPSYSDLSNLALQKGSDSSSTVMGDFIPIDYQDIKMHPLPEEEERAFTQVLNRRKAPAMNPYEFDPNSPDVDRNQHTRFSDFIGRSRGLSNPRPTQITNSHSEASCLLMGLSPDEGVKYSIKSHGIGLQRSESSPNLTPGLFAARHERTTATTGSSQLYSGEKLSRSPSRRGCQRGEEMLHHEDEETEDRASSHSRGRVPVLAQQPTSIASSPSRLPRQGHSQDKSSRLSDHRHSITKELEDLAEHDEPESITDFSPILSWPPTPPPRRSRSPMKKMFGEHGWLGYTPDVKDDQKMTNSSSNLRRKDLSSVHRKTTMIEKLRNKLEEIAEKADMSPSKGHFRSESGKHSMAPSAVLSVSVGPPHQARMFMEMELMIIHTANTFLMNEFSHGRFVVETLKKTVDSWKRAGRPTVIEFMYDQATQRDLVAANQHNFRFHSIRPTDNVRVSSMLYNWKQVASTMAIRTFCAADTVILKLIFDIEQILELLGAGHPIMLRLQQIRAEVNELVSFANKKKSNLTNSKSAQDTPENNTTHPYGQSFYSYLLEE